MLWTVGIIVIVLCLAYAFLPRMIEDAKYRAGEKRHEARMRAGFKEAHPLEAEVISRVLAIPLQQWTWWDNSRDTTDVGFSSKTDKGAEVYLRRSENSYQETVGYELTVGGRRIASMECEAHHTWPG